MIHNYRTPIIRDDCRLWNRQMWVILAILYNNVYCFIELQNLFMADIELISKIMTVLSYPAEATLSFSMAVKIITGLEWPNNVKVC